MSVQNIITAVSITAGHLTAVHYQTITGQVYPG